MPNWMPSLYPGGRARLIPRRTSFNASRRSPGSAARYSVTVDAGMGRVYHERFCRSNCNVGIHADARKRSCQGHGAAVRQPDVTMFRRDTLLAKEVILATAFSEK